MGEADWKGAHNMNCPRCGFKTHVNGTLRIGDFIVRYRQCQHVECCYTFKTTSTPEVIMDPQDFPPSEWDAMK